MFCNHCGAQLQPTFRVCPNCGSSIAGQVYMPSQGRVARHIKTLAILWMIVGAVWLIPASIMLMLGSFAHMLPLGDLPRALGPFFLNIVGGVFLLVAAGGICVGWGLMQRRSWARTTALVLSILALFHPPFFTALGVYTLWVLVPGDADREYHEMAGA